MASGLRLLTVGCYRASSLRVASSCSKKLAGQHPIDDAVVEAQAHVHHVTDGDRVVDDNRTFDDRTPW